VYVTIILESNGLILWDTMPERPPAKDHKLNVRVDPEIYAAAEAKAKARGSTVSKIVRAFLVLFAHDETPPGWPPELPEIEIRAEKRPRPKKRK